MFTYGSFLMIATFVVLWFALNRTAWGRHVYAVGDDKEAADLSGILTDRLLLSVYTVAGLVCGLAAWVSIGRVGSVSPPSFAEANLDSITAVVIGGTSLFGGRGTIMGALFRCADRRGVQLRAQARRRRRDLAALRDRVPDHPRGRHRPVDPEDLQLNAPATGTDGATTGAETGATTTGPGPKLVMEARGLVKRYGRVTALDRADFDLRENEILAVIGDNGAGKSSMIKAISGATVPDEGQVLLDGREVHFRSPMEAREAGIETVYQNLALSPALSIADNMFLGREIRHEGGVRGLLRMLDRKKMEQVARDKLSELGLMTIQNIGQAVETLSGGQRQGVAVARAAAFGSRVIIMDEPTAALGVKESRRVLELIQDVRSRGMPIVLISHNMPHVFEVADRVHVHRLGRRLCVLDPKRFTMNDAVAFMTGAAEPPPETMPAPASAAA